MGMYVTSHLWYLYTHIHRHDFNSALGQGKTFANWDDIKHHWDAYAQQAIGGEEHNNSDERCWTNALPEERAEEAANCFTNNGRWHTNDSDHPRYASIGEKGCYEDLCDMALS